MSSNTIKTVESVNLDRFMGEWYVIAHIPTFIEKNAFNAVESYELNKDGTIAPHLHLTKAHLTEIIKFTGQKVLLKIIKLMLNGVCSLYGQLKRNIK